MWTFVIWLVLLIAFLWAWIRLMQGIGEDMDDDYMMGDDDSDWGDKS